MERYGRSSCTGNSRHINIRYFFVKYLVGRGEVKIECCPTQKMLAYFFTKPLQGGNIGEFKDLAMLYKHITTLLTDKLSIMELVGYRKTPKYPDVSIIDISPYPEKSIESFKDIPAVSTR